MVESPPQQTNYVKPATGSPAIATIGNYSVVVGAATLQFTECILIHVCVGKGGRVQSWQKKMRFAKPKRLCEGALGFRVPGYVLLPSGFSGDNA